MCQAAEGPAGQRPSALQEIRTAETKADAEAALDAFIENYQVKYQKAADCLNNQS
jgi:hypothetical protein